MSLLCQVYSVSSFTLRVLRNSHRISRLFALVILLLFINATTWARTSEKLKEILLNKAFSENLIRQPQPEINDTALSILQPNQPLNINSMKVGFQWMLILPIRLHQKVITYQDGDTCTFEPSCSHYGLEAIRRYGFRGLLMASDRLLRCYSGNQKYYPVFSGLAYDPVPSK